MSSAKSLLQIYNPKTLDELKLPVRIHNLIGENIEREGYRLLFFGTPGTGKTTTSRLISKGHDVLYLSGSNDFNVEVMRTKVYPFCSNFSVLDKQKTIIIDEAENISNKIQDAFKITLDKSIKVNFIFITNEIEKMNTAVRSRCTQIEYNFTQAEQSEQEINYVKFAKKICVEQNIPHDGPGLKELYKLKFPDFRAILVILQQILDGKQTVTVETVNQMTDNGIMDVELYSILNETDPQKFYEKLSIYKGQEREALISLGEPFFKFLNSQNKFDQTLKCAIIVAKYSNMFVVSINKFGTFFSCCCELRLLLR